MSVLCSAIVSFKLKWINIASCHQSIQHPQLSKTPKNILVGSLLKVLVYLRWIETREHRLKVWVSIRKV